MLPLPLAFLRSWLTKGLLQFGVALQAVLGRPQKGWPVPTQAWLAHAQLQAEPPRSHNALLRGFSRWQCPFLPAPLCHAQPWPVCSASPRLFMPATE